jgi:sec-independent protein translocase protein TatA
MNEWVIVAIVAFVILFGAKKLPELARGLGQGIKEFKKAVNTDEEKNNAKIEQPKPQANG